MTKHRMRARTDNNQADIVKDLRKHPCITVETRHDDILVGFRGKTYWYEIKNPEKSTVKLGQKKLDKEWQGHYKIVEFLHEILMDLGVMK